MAKAIFSIRKPISAEALSKESVLATVPGRELKPKANRYKDPLPGWSDQGLVAAGFFTGAAVAGFF